MTTDEESTEMKLDDALTSLRAVKLNNLSPIEQRRLQNAMGDVKMVQQSVRWRHKMNDYDATERQ